MKKIRRSKQEDIQFKINHNLNKIRNNNHKTYNNNKIYKHQFNKNKFINTIKCYQIKLILFKDVILKNQNDLLQ